MKTLLTVGLIGTLLVCARPAAADGTVVHYQRNAAVCAADLDLAREADARVLYERIDYAARSICTTDARPFVERTRRQWWVCVESAVANAVERAGAPLLTAIHLARRERLARL